MTLKNTNDTLQNEYQPHFLVNRFTEKPNLETAQKYLEAGRYFWNSGMFIFTARLFLEELKAHCPDIHKLALLSAKSKKNKKMYFPKMPDISVDYALMEKSDKLGVAKGNFGWDDIGSYLALTRIAAIDENKNIPVGNIAYRQIKSSNNILACGDQKTKFALLGIDSLVIVKQGNLILIADQKKISEIKKLREKFPEEDR